MAEFEERGSFALSCASRAVANGEDLDWLYAEVGRFGAGAFWESVGGLDLAHSVDVAPAVKALLHSLVGALVFQHLPQMKSSDAHQLLVLLANSANRLAECDIPPADKLRHIADAGSCLVRAAEFGEISIKELQYAWWGLGQVMSEGHPDGEDSWHESLAMLGRCLCLICTRHTEGSKSRIAGEKALSIFDFLLGRIGENDKWYGKSLEWKALTMVALARTSENPMMVLREAHDHAITAYAWFRAQECE